MEFYFTPTKSQLRVFSSIFSNLAAGWFAALFVTRNPITLTANILLAIVSVYLAVKADEFAEEL